MDNPKNYNPAGPVAADTGRPLPMPVSDGLIVSGYADKNFLERRKEFCNWILKNAEKWPQCPNCKFIAKGKDGIIFDNKEKFRECNGEVARFKQLFCNKCNSFLPYNRILYHSPSAAFYVLTPDMVLSKPEYFNGYNFNSSWNTREILLSECVIELESNDLDLNWKATLETIWNLQKFQEHFAVFYSPNMRGPHIHLYNRFLDVRDWAEKELAMALFCRQVVPFEYFHLLDRSLFGQHTIALEFSSHWRTNCMLKLLYENIPEQNGD